jgi:NAD(P)-dependent dehydrogenase (short-subunit alcohol dehydrogenase family)
VLKRVLVTGGAHRLGALLCARFAAAGWEVWCHYQRSAEAAKEIKQLIDRSVQDVVDSFPVFGVMSGGREANRKQQCRLFMQAFATAGREFGEGRLVMPHMD